MMRTHRALVSLTNMQSNMLMIVTISAVVTTKDPILVFVEVQHSAESQKKNVYRIKVRNSRPKIS